MRNKWSGCLMSNLLSEYVDKEETLTDSSKAEQRSLSRRSTTHNDILYAAIQEFAAFGFNGASTSAIARRAKTKQPLLNYHFGSKNKLWEAAVNYVFTELEAAFQTIRETGGDLEPIDLLKLILRTFNRFSSRHPQHIEILRYELGSGSKRETYLLNRFLKPMYQYIDKIIEAATIKGQIKPIPAKYLSSILMGAVTNFYSVGSIMNEIYSVDTQDHTEASTHGDWLIQVIFEGLKP